MRMAENTITKPKLLVIAGPTAVGKSGTAIRAAKRYGGEIISADSIQVYRGMDIGSAKVTESEMDGIPHHLINIMDPSEDYNVHMFQRMASEAAAGIAARGRLPILCGGTGFYIQAFLYGIDLQEEENTPETESYRSMLQEIMDQSPPETASAELFELLKTTDPAAAAVLHPNNRKRVMRALLYFHSHGKSITEHNMEESRKRLQGREYSPYDYLFFVLNRDRQKLYQQIDARVGQMFEEGLEAEARRLYDAGIPRKGTAAQGIGYKELFDYFDGNGTLDEAADRIRLASRRFAKRQLTWFRRENDVIWINTEERDPLDEIGKYISQYWSE